MLSVRCINIILLSITLLSLTRPIEAIEYYNIIEVIADEEKVPAPLLASICYVESQFDHKAIAYDDGGSNSYGLCQIKLGTAKSVGFNGDPNELLKFTVNVRYAAKYLKSKLVIYGNERKAALAYNAGKYIASKSKKNHAVNEIYWIKVKEQMELFKNHYTIVSDR